ncbi:hypothetical protein RB195_015911 [Necator americanus]
MLALVTMVPLLVISLRCYNGSEGSVVAVNSHTSRMCVYETNRPCEFKQQPVSGSNYRMVSFTSEYAKGCYNKNSRAVCYCTSTLCNGNFKLILEHWKSTPHPNKMEYDCVKEYLKNKKNLELPKTTETVTNSTTTIPEKLLKSTTHRNTTTKKQTSTTSKFKSSKKVENKTVVPKTSYKHSTRRRTTLKKRTLSTRRPNTQPLQTPFIKRDTTTLERRIGVTSKKTHSPLPVKLLAYGVLIVAAVVLLCLLLPVLVACALVKARQNAGRNSPQFAPKFDERRRSRSIIAKSTMPVASQMRTEREYTKTLDSTMSKEERKSVEKRKINSTSKEGSRSTDDEKTTSKEIRSTEEKKVKAVSKEGGRSTEEKKVKAVSKEGGRNRRTTMGSSSEKLTLPKQKEKEKAKKESKQKNTTGRRTSSPMPA